MPRSAQASNKPGRVALICRVVSLWSLAAFIAAHLRPELVERHGAQHRFSLAEHFKRHPDRALAARIRTLGLKRVKTKASERVVPVHPQLVTLGFLKYVEGRASDDQQAWLFPAVAPDQGRALSAWGKWWSRHLRQTVGIVDADRVFHSFRHGFQDALRRATPDEELRDALSGRSNHKSVGRTYGAKNMLERWGAPILTEAISNISYPGLNLSRVRPVGVQRRTRRVNTTKA
jgi:hypothetical protein